MDKKDRPRIKIQPTRFDIAIEVFAWMALAFLWAYVIIGYPALPEIIPTHFGMGGKADAWGSKDSVFMGPGFATLIMLFVTFIQRKPHTFNYNEDITPENAERQYTLMVRMLRVLKACIGLLFILIEYTTGAAAIEDDTVDSKWLFLGVFLLIQLPAFYFLTKALNKK
ncbi:MAG: hypothetical protein DI539_05330 [Flavobacterium psychrophilum]|nr:MAG: hypothetical protein DI539_05330 [Flavobacterium psychrophilum]